MDTEQTTHKKLYRSRTNKKLAGVCGGVAEYFNIDATLIRVILVIITLASGFAPGVLAYIIAVLIIPREPAAPHPMP